MVAICPSYISNISFSFSLAFSGVVLTQKTQDLNVRSTMDKNTVRLNIEKLTHN